MALTVTNLYKWCDVATGNFVSIVKVTGDSSYPNTGGTVGYPISASTFGFNTFAATNDFGTNSSNTGPSVVGAYYVIADLAVSTGGTYSQPDATTGNLRMYGAGGTEITNTSSAAGNSAILMARGH